MKQKTGRKVLGASVGVSTFAGAAAWTAIVAASYPVAIWGIGFAAYYKLHQLQLVKRAQANPRVCPLAEQMKEAAASVDTHVSVSR